MRRFFAAVALPKQNPFFAKACDALREIHACSLAFGSASKLREDLQTPVGFSVSLQPHGVVEIRPAHSISRTCQLFLNFPRSPRGSVRASGLVLVGKPEVIQIGICGSVPTSRHGGGNPEAGAGRESLDADAFTATYLGLRKSLPKNRFAENPTANPAAQGYMKGWYYEVAEDADYTAGKSGHEKPFYFTEVRDRLQ